LSKPPAAARVVARAEKKSWGGGLTEERWAGHFEVSASMKEVSFAVAGAFEGWRRARMSMAVTAGRDMRVFRI
jgi:hypothetical protein